MKTKSFIYLCCIAISLIGCDKKPTNSLENYIFEGNFSIKNRKVIFESVLNYIKFCDTERDSVDIVILQIYSYGKNRDYNVYISATKSIDNLYNDYPAMYMYLDQKLILIYSDIEAFIEPNTKWLDKYHTDINEFIRKRMIVNQLMYDPVNWVLRLSSNPNSFVLDKKPPNNEIVENLYRLKSKTIEFKPLGN
jgi:hypothetical protein